jgi:hypothetical protein
LRFEKQSLKNELNKAMRIISREIGENINLDEFLLQENSWKGRAQQIQILQAKIRELQLKISTELNGTINGMSSMTGSSFGGSGGKIDERRKETEQLKLAHANMVEFIFILKKTYI